MTKKKILGVLSLALLIFAFMFGATTSSQYSLGDSILRFLGLKAWSKESIEHSARGFHYTFFYTVGFAILGYMGAKHFLKEIYPKLINRLPTIVLVLFFTGNLLFSWGYSLVLSFSTGVNAVDYFPAQSNCKYKLNPENNLALFSYSIKLKNYSNDEVKFNMRVQNPSFDDYIMVDVPDQGSKGNPTLKDFTLLPKEERIVTFSFNDESQYQSGNMNRPNIAIFNQESIREFNVQ